MPVGQSGAIEPCWCKDSRVKVTTPAMEVTNVDANASNFIERTFGETRRRVKVIGRLPGETSCLTLVWAVLDRASRGWRGFTMTASGLRQLQDLRRSLLEPPAQLRPRTVTAAQIADSPETVRATA